MTHPAKIRRTRFDETFKRNVVEIAEQGTLTIVQIAEEYGVSERNIYTWKKQYGRPASQGTTPGTEGDLAAENARLHRELEAMTRQRDILKKACAILGQEQGNASR